VDPPHQRRLLPAAGDLRRDPAVLSASREGFIFGQFAGLTATGRKNADTPSWHKFKEDLIDSGFVNAAQPGVHEVINPALK
jgi:hypothetical protein